MKNTLKFIFSIIICQLAGAIGALFTTPSIDSWYDTLVKPSFVPPNSVFGPVWTTLFVLMGISLFLIWKKGLEKREIKIAVSLFALQLILNVLWSFIFFGAHSLVGGFIEIIFLWLSILVCIVYFWKISKGAALLLVPYILWVSFAGFLNFSLISLNSGMPQNPSHTTLPDETDSWKTLADESSGVTFKYPQNIDLKYVSLFDWPPKVQIINEEFTCTEAGTPTLRGGQTTKEEINGTKFCVTKIMEGAAGSTYTEYAYAFPVENKTAIFTFTLRSPNCGNYDEPQMSECKAEQDSFDFRPTVSKIAKSLKF